MMFQQVYRNADLSRAAARVFFHFPILWLTGKYSLTNSKVFRFIPSKDREGYEERKESLFNSNNLNAFKLHKACLMGRPQFW